MSSKILAHGSAKSPRGIRGGRRRGGERCESKAKEVSSSTRRAEKVVRHCSERSEARDQKGEGQTAGHHETGRGMSNENVHQEKSKMSTMQGSQDGALSASLFRA